MNILLIANELRYTCGVTNHLLHLSRGLTSAGGINLYIITGGGNGIERFNDIDVNVTLDNRFLHSNRNSVNYLSAVNMLSKYVKQNNIDIVHSHSHYSANIASHASLFKRITRIQTNHGILDEAGSLKHFNADKYIAINEHIFKFLLDNSIAKPEDISFIRCGIYIPPEPSLKPDAPLKVIAASRFTFEKGLDIYIKAVALAKPKLSAETQFFIAGEGDQEQSLKKLDSELGAGIGFLGRVTNMGEVLKQTHILVYPSRSKREGFPAIITEAGAYNNLLISSLFDGVDSVVKNGEDSILKDSDDPSKFSEALAQVINNYSGYAPMALKFYQKMKELFDAGLTVRKHIKLYEQCLSR